MNEESNYCFGEGGAGAYSDGKLYTRSKKRGSVDKILNVFCQHGASTNILADAHPHIGTDKLPRVIEAMRHTILRSGGEVHFQTKMTRLIIDSSSSSEDAGPSGRVVGVEAIETFDDQRTASCEKEFRGPVILATGQSLLVFVWNTRRCSLIRYSTIIVWVEESIYLLPNIPLLLR